MARAYVWFESVLELPITNALTPVIYSVGLACGGGCGFLRYMNFSRAPRSVQPLVTCAFLVPYISRLVYFSLERLIFCLLNPVES